MAPAAPTLLPSPPPITDRIALGALTHTFPPELVDRVIEQTGRAEQRRRLLPARVVVYFVLALALYSHAAYEEVMRCLVEGLGWAQHARRGRRTWPWWHVPGASALAEARERLGAEPLRALFAKAARPLATKATRGGVVSPLAGHGHGRDLSGCARQSGQPLASSPNTVGRVRSAWARRAASASVMSGTVRSATVAGPYRCRLSSVGMIYSSRGRRSNRTPSACPARRRR